MGIFLLKCRPLLRFCGSHHLFQEVCVVAALDSLDGGSVMDNNGTTAGCDDCSLL